MPVTPESSFRLNDAFVNYLNMINFSVPPGSASRTGPALHRTTVGALKI